jgi:3-oxoacyl-[acyl-carrier protein] reductase
MDLGLEGRVALVSGGSRGLGRAVALELGAEGAHVVVVARDPEAINDTVGVIRARGGSASGVSADMTDKDGVATAVSAAQQVSGTVDIGVFNVYGPTSGVFDEVEDDDFRTAFNDMVLSLHWLTKSLLPGMKMQQWGRLITVNSVSSKEVHRELPLFTASPSRVAAVSYNKSLSAEVAADGITVNTLGVGRFATERFRRYMGDRATEQGRAAEDVIRERGEAVPRGRLGEPEEFGAVAAFLCSRQASFLTGQFVVVDGGYGRTLW